MDKFAYHKAITAARDLTPALKCAAYAVWDRVDARTGECFMSAKTLSEDMGYRDKGHKTAKKALSTLKDKGYLRLTKKGGQWDGRNWANVYALTLPATAVGANDKNNTTVEGVGGNTPPTPGGNTPPPVGGNTPPPTDPASHPGSDPLKNPVTPAATPAGQEREIKENQHETPAPVVYGQDGYDADGTPWKTTILTAWLYWAHSTTDRESENNLDVLLELIGRRNGEQVADYARNYWRFSESRAADVALAGDEDDQRYAAGAEYKLLLRTAAQDPMHAVDVENPPADDGQQPLYVVTREETLGAPSEQPQADEQLEDTSAAEEFTPAAQSAGLAPLIAQQRAQEASRKADEDRRARWAQWDAQEAAGHPTGIIPEAEEIPEDYHQEFLPVVYVVPEPRQELVSGPQSGHQHPQSTTSQGYQPPTEATPWAVREISA